MSTADVPRKARQGRQAKIKLYVCAFVPYNKECKQAKKLIRLLPAAAVYAYTVPVHRAMHTHMHLNIQASNKQASK